MTGQHNFRNWKAWPSGITARCSGFRNGRGTHNRTRRRFRRAGLPRELLALRVHPRRGQVVELWKVRLTGAPPGHKRQLTASTSSNMDANVSFDGSMIAFRSLRSGHPAVWISAINGSGTRQLVDPGAEGCGNPRWSPDGRWAHFTRESAETATSGPCAPKTGERRRLTHLLHHHRASSLLSKRCGFENGLVTRFLSTCVRPEPISA